MYSNMPDDVTDATSSDGASSDGKNNTAALLKKSSGGGIIMHFILMEKSDDRKRRSGAGCLWRWHLPRGRGLVCTGFSKPDGKRILGESGYPDHHSKRSGAVYGRR